MKKIIVISGHGNYATGLQSSIELLAGKNEDVYYVDFELYDTDLTLKERFNDLFSKNPDSKILFICDIAGGTPFKTAAEIAYGSDNVEVVAGCNIVAIIEAMLQRATVPLEQLAENIITSSRNSTIRFQKADRNIKAYSSPDFDEGI